MDAKFNSLSSIYNLTNPGTLSGDLKKGFGVKGGDYNIVEEMLDMFVSSTAKGVKRMDLIKSTIADRLKKTTDDDAASVKELFSIIDVDGPCPGLDNEYWKTPTGDSVSNVSAIIGGGSTVSNLLKEQNVGAVLIRTPFVHPAKRNTNECDLFLNAFPTLHASKMVPYLNVEFQTFSPAGQSGLMRFLMGSAPVVGKADEAIIQGNTIINATDAGIDPSVTYGMEVFTSPQTLVNMDSLAASSDRYVDVLNPFAPLASIEALNISVVPAGAGTFTYKKATLTMKLHDRSRLVELSELITPKRYKDVTVWLTYGWLAPQDDSEYSTFVNEKMLQREAYGIVNSSFTFDNVGQITLNIELFTKGAAQLQTTPITGDNVAEVDRLMALAEEISRLRSLTVNDPPEGLGRDLRIYQMLDSAQAGAFPDMNVKQAQEAIIELEKSFNKSKGGDKQNEKKLIASLKNFYGAKGDKFSHKETLENQVSSIVQKRFEEITRGPDPFLPTGASKKKFVSQEVSSACESYVKEPENKKTKKSFKRAVSFGKLFSTFVLPPLLSRQTVDEVQLIFYALNEQCGPISLHSIAEFPVDLIMFMDQYRDHVAANGGERMSIAEFMQLVINSQFMDNRAIGYGLRAFYEPYDAKNPEARLKGGNAEKEFESSLAAQVSRYGGFKKPNVDMYVETLHQSTLKSGERSTRSPLIDQLGDSIRTFTERDSLSPDQRKLRGQTTILRIHVYDKQLSPYNDVDAIVKADASGGTLFATVNVGKLQNELKDRRMKSGSTFLKEQFVDDMVSSVTTTGMKTYKLVGADGKGSSTLVRDYLSNTVPKITFGTNGTTIISAALASKQDALLSTVNMLKNDRIKNTVAPNGAGDYGLPMRVVPAALSLTTLGCPLASMAQQYFVDFQTGTTLDNLYIVTGLAHVIGPGKFETSWTMSYSDAYGRFVGAQNISDLISDLAKKVDQSEKETKKK